MPAQPALPTAPAKTGEAMIARALQCEVHLVARAGFQVGECQGRGMGDEAAMSTRYAASIKAAGLAVAIDEEEAVDRCQLGVELFPTADRPLLRRRLVEPRNDFLTGLPEAASSLPPQHRQSANAAPLPSTRSSSNDVMFHGCPPSTDRWLIFRHGARLSSDASKIPGACIACGFSLADMIVPPHLRSWYPSFTRNPPWRLSTVMRDVAYWRRVCRRFFPLALILHHILSSWHGFRVRDGLLRQDRHAPATCREEGTLLKRENIIWGTFWAFSGILFRGVLYD